jgi:hypothetical protein
MHIQWWGDAFASGIVISSSCDGGQTWEKQRTEKEATKRPSGEGIQEWHGGIPGWTAPTTHVKLELTKGRKDLWGHGRWFAIHHVRVMGYVGAGQHGKEHTPLEWQEVGSHESADTVRDIDIGCMKSTVAGWPAATRVVRLELVNVGKGRGHPHTGRFEITQFNVHGGSFGAPSTARAVLMEEAAYRLDRDIVQERYYPGNVHALRTGLASESSSGKDRPLLLALEYVQSHVFKTASSPWAAEASALALVEKMAVAAEIDRSRASAWRIVVPASVVDFWALDVKFLRFHTDSEYGECLTEAMGWQPIDSGNAGNGWEPARALFGNAWWGGRSITMEDGQHKGEVAFYLGLRKASGTTKGEHVRSVSFECRDHLPQCDIPVEALIDGEWTWMGEFSGREPGLRQAAL